MQVKTMTDDIVTRLRGKYQGQLPICIEAADEIERLRYILEELKFQHQKLLEKYNQKEKKMNDNELNWQWGRSVIGWHVYCSTGYTYLGRSWGLTLNSAKRRAKKKALR